MRQFDGRGLRCGILMTAGLFATGQAGGEAVYPEIDALESYLADPCVIADGDVFFLVATGEAPDGRRLPIYRSEDLRRWTFVRGAVDRGPEGAWNRRNFWAPEIHALDGRFYLYYTAMPDGTPANEGNRVGVAVADAVGGPYEDLGVVVPHGSLDGSVFTDTDGTRYLLYTTEVNSDAGFPQGQVLIDRLVTPTRVAGQPQAIIDFHGWNEGAAMIRHGGKYHIFFSTGSWKSDGYCVRWAVADAPTGPFVEPDPAHPLLTTVRPDMIGPGHGFPWLHPDGTWRYTFHAWDEAMTRRSPRFARLDWHDGRPVFTPLDAPSQAE